MPGEPKPLVLIVDDMPSNLHVLAAILGDDYRIKVATSGRQAIEVAAREPLDLVLLDVMMPDMSGHETLERLRALPRCRDVPVIFITADASEQHEVAGLEEGADDYITKPVAPAVLRARVRNLMRRARAERKLQLAARALESTGEGIVITDAGSRIIDVNGAYCRMMGYSRDEVIGQTPRMNRSGRHDQAFYQAMWRSLLDTGLWVGEVWDRRKDGSEFPKWLSIAAVRDEQGELTHYIGVFSDISVLKTAEERLQRMAFYDGLTGLPNRVLFRDRLEHEITVSHRYEQRAAVLFLDLDRFKYVNDNLGHEAGDSLLKTVAERLRETVRENDTVARLGGDEFTVLLRDVKSGEAAAAVAEAIVRRMAETIFVDGQEVHVGASVGIAIYPDDGRDFETLTKHADTAMYHAKESGRGQFRFFTEAMDHRARTRMIMETELHHALERGEFHLVYQPQADVATGKLVAAEALLRWRHPRHGQVSPNDFIPLAEETGLIHAIGDWVIREVCRQIGDWLERGLPLMPVAVNLSPRQFHQPDLAERILACLDEAGLPPEALMLEITESTLMDKSEATRTMLTTLAGAGLSIAIDDFGTGYSSLAYLKDFPVDRIKVDRSFVTDIPAGGDESVLASAIIQLGKSLGLRLVAEGVETEGQRDFLDSQGCHRLQGFWYSHPLPPDEFEAFTRRNVEAGSP